MIERVARAMCQDDGFKWDPADWSETANGETPEEQRDYWRDKARTAIKAMREPTWAMHLAGVKAYLERETNCRPAALRDAYDAWIDAALQEEGE